MGAFMIIIMFLGSSFGQYITLNEYKLPDNKTCENSIVYKSILNYTEDSSVKDVYFEIKKVNDADWTQICHFEFRKDCNINMNCKCKKEKGNIIEIEIHYSANSSNIGASIRGTTILLSEERWHSEVKKIPDIFKDGSEFGQLFINKINIPSNMDTCVQEVNNTDLMINFTCEVLPCFIELSFNDSTDIRRGQNISTFNKTYHFDTNLILTIKYVECSEDGHTKSYTCLIKRGEYFENSSTSKSYLINNNVEEDVTSTTIAVSIVVTLAGGALIIVLIILCVRRRRMRRRFSEKDINEAVSKQNNIQDFSIRIGTENKFVRDILNTERGRQEGKQERELIEDTQFTSIPGTRSLQSERVINEGINVQTQNEQFTSVSEEPSLESEMEMFGLSMSKRLSPENMPGNSDIGILEQTEIDDESSITFLKKGYLMP